MKKLFVFAALALVSVPAHAQNSFSFEINGRTVRIAVPKKCDDDQCVSITSGKANPDDKSHPGDQRIDASKLGGILSDLMKGQHGSDDTLDDAPAPPPVRADRTPPLVRTPSAEPPAYHAGPVIPPRATVATPAASEPAVVPPPVPAPVETTSLNPVTPPVVVAPPAVAVAPAPVVPAPVQAAATPAGIWVTQNKEGKVHIVPCGNNYCGYVVDSQSARDGTKVLIDMKTLDGKQWSGHVHDPKGGGTYDATMALKSPDALTIRGCAFGGMICRGQTWSRS